MENGKEKIIPAGLNSFRFLWNIAFDFISTENKILLSFIKCR